MQRFLVASGRGHLLYEAFARALGAYLARGLRASAYARGSVAARDVVPGLSDVDLLLVVDGDPGPARERWERLRRALPPIGDLARVAVYERETVRERAAATALTYGLEETDGARRALYYGPRPPEQDDPLHHRPGLWGAGRDWRLLHGPERRPTPGEPDPQQRRIAAWLEVQSCWRHAFRAAGDELAPAYRRYLLPKLVADMAGVWLAVDRGEQAGGRADALRRVTGVMPDEADRLALASRQLDPRATPVGDPLTIFLPSLVAITELVADRLRAELAAADAVGVRLIGGRPAELVVAGDAARDRLLPLSDWRSVVLGALPDPAFAICGDPCDADAMRAGVTDGGPYQALHGSGLLVLPSDWPRGIFRAVQFAGTDPVSFALLDGAEEARFPEVPGWSARDWASRGVAEHAAWLDASDRSAGEVLATLLTAARVALFADSLDTGDPFLPLSAADTAARLVDENPSAGGVVEQAMGEYGAWSLGSELPDPATVDALETVVVAQASYGGPDGSRRRIGVRR